MRAAVATSPKKNFDIVTRDRPQPGSGQVRLKVAACGVCYSDHLVKDGLWPGVQYPRVPGHEVAGTVDAVGAGVTHVAVGTRMGLGWGTAADSADCLALARLQGVRAWIETFPLDPGVRPRHRRGPAPSGRRDRRRCHGAVERRQAGARGLNGYVSPNSLARSILIRSRISPAFSNSRALAASRICFSRTLISLSRSSIVR